MCVVTRQRSAPDDLIRFVRAPDGMIVPDLKHKLPGRGAYVTSHRDVLQKAVKSGQLARALEAEKSAADTLVSRVEELLVRQVMGALGLARRSGDLVLGASKVEAEVRKGAARFVLHAKEASPDGIHKITKARRAVRFEDGPDIPAINCFSSAQLGLALGAENVIHAAAIGNRQAKAAERQLMAFLCFQNLWPEKSDFDQPIGQD